MMAKKRKATPAVLAKFTLERIGKPPGSRRHLTVTDDGAYGWGDDEVTFKTFADQASAERFRSVRLRQPDEAAVVRRTVH